LATECALARRQRIAAVIVDIGDDNGTFVGEPMYDIIDIGAFP